MPATLESGGPHSAALLSPQSFGRPAQLLVLALRDTTVLIGKQLAMDRQSPRWRLHIAHSVTSAWQRLTDINFDLILVDLGMEEVRQHLSDLIAAAGATLVYGLCDDEHGEVALDARREGVADVLSTQHFRGPSTVRIMRLLLESARGARYSRLLAAAVEGAPVAYAMVDALQPDLPLVYVNEHFVTLTGYQPSEVIGRNCRFLQGPLTDSRDIDRLREAVTKAQPIYVELINYRKDGQPFWNGVLLRPIRTPTGTITHFIATLRDVSERRHTDGELERSARLHRLLIEASGGMTIFAAPDGQLRRPLPEFEAFTGLRFEEYRAGLWTAVIHPDDRKNFSTSRETALREQREISLVFRLWHAPTGAWRFVELHLLPLFDAQQQLSEWIGTLTDVDERQTRAQEQVQNRNFLRSALDALPLYLLHADREGIVRWVNRACLEWLGVQADALIGKPLLDLADATDRQLLPRRIRAVLDGRAQRYTEVVTLCHRSATLDACFVPLRNADDNDGFLWIGTDPEEQHRLSEATQHWLLNNS